MHFTAIAETDIGTTKNINQDSVLIKHAKIDNNEILMAFVCDGVGGLSKGELASATAVRLFSDWFVNELPYELDNFDINAIGNVWKKKILDINDRIIRYSNEHGIKGSGTTLTGILFINGEYVIGHIGDTRVYYIDQKLEQLTTDHSFIAREIARGTMTPEQARIDRRRNLLLQCIGSSKQITPDILVGHIKKGIYMLCSDGFRHEISPEEIYNLFKPTSLLNKDVMHKNAKQLIKLDMERGERDNISVVLIKVEWGILNVEKRWNTWWQVRNI